jgi:chitin synthase
MYRLWARRTLKEGGGGGIIPILASPEIINTYSLQDPKTLHSKNLLTLGEDRYLTTLMLKTFPRRKLTYVPDAICETTVPDSMRVLISQRRRWINSTLHNLMELLTVPNLCGTFCFSMQFVIFCDLIGSVTAPASVAFLIYLAVLIVTTGMTFARMLALLLMAGAVGLQAILVFFTSLRPSMLWWLLCYVLATPVWSVILPLYAFWHFDDFSWYYIIMFIM